MNTNPTLLIAQALERAGDITQDDKKYAELRIYPQNGAGWFFVSAKNTGKWYWKDEPGADYFVRAAQAEFEQAIQDGARVQLIGSRGRSLALWRNWKDFAEAMGK